MTYTVHEHATGSADIFSERLKIPLIAPGGSRGTHWARQERKLFLDDYLA